MSYARGKSAESDCPLRKAGRAEKKKIGPHVTPADPVSSWYRNQQKEMEP
jgi:hypothetical protein